MSAQRTHPVILAHGIARFDFLRQSLENESRKIFGNVFDRVLLHLANHGIKIPTDRLHYFRGILTHLKEDGFDVHHTNVSFAARVADRAAILKRQIEEILSSTGAARVHIIAHSMGGLDARFMITKLGMSERVASLTTIGTPHTGSSFADEGLEEGGTALIDVVGQALDLRGFADLATAPCLTFNESVRNLEAANGVFYQTYSSSEERSAVFAPLQLAWDVIKRREQDDNDGLVAVKSQAWVSEIVGDDGTRKPVIQNRFPLPADHLNEVGWWDLEELNGDGPFHRLDQRNEFESAIKQVYLGIARDLRARFPV
jgi:triacylglycerol esterase/lipase EstA (alpha/beta hydrolase family)